MDRNDPPRPHAADHRGAGARAARERHRHARRPALRHPRRQPDRALRPGPHDPLRPARATPPCTPRPTCARSRPRRSIPPATRRSASAPPPRRAWSASRVPSWSGSACASSSARAASAPASLEAFGELGGAYLAVIGGTAALETTWVEAIEDVDLDDLNPGIPLEVPGQRLRPPAGGHGQPRRQPLRRGRRQGPGAGGTVRWRGSGW